MTTGNATTIIANKGIQPIGSDTKVQRQYRSIEDTLISHEMFNQILCPNLRIGVRMGFLNPDEFGWVRSIELRAFLEYLGVRKSSGIANLLILAGEEASTPTRKDFTNIIMFRDSRLDHKSSSGILNTPEGFSESRLSLLKRYAGTDDRLTVKTSSPAINHFHQCPHLEMSVRGTHIHSLEMAIIIEFYGRTDKGSIEKYLTQNDIDSIWRDNKFPEGWTPPDSPKYGTLESIKLYSKMILSRIKHGWNNIAPIRS